MGRNTDWFLNVLTPNKRITNKSGITTDTIKPIIQSFLFSFNSNHKIKGDAIIAVKLTNMEMIFVYGDIALIIR